MTNVTFFQKEKNMKFKYVFPVILVAALAIMAFAPMQALELPGEVVDLVNMLVLVGLTALAKLVMSWIGVDLHDKAAELATVVAAVVVVFINYALGLVPGEFEPWINMLFKILVVVFGGNGVFGLFFRAKYRE